MEHKERFLKLRPQWWAIISLAVMAAFVLLVSAMFNKSFTPTVPVTLVSDRTGLVMETGAKVKLRGVQVGTVKGIAGGSQQASLSLSIYGDQLANIPANVDAQIRATTAFGGKYVDLIYPERPVPQRLSAHTVLTSRNVTTEVNTVFENLVGLLKQIDPAKLNSILSALAEGVRGQGEQMGQAITDANDVLLALNSRTETLRQNWRSLKGFSDTYAAAAPDIIATLDAASTTSRTITSHAAELDALLLNTIGFSDAGVALIAPNVDNLTRSVSELSATTGLLHKYQPTYTCLLMGAHWYLENGGRDVEAGNGRSLVMDSGLLLGQDPYRYPNHLPLVAAKGGPGGTPSCGSLPEVDKNFPVRQLITDTGFGTGLDFRPNPGIGFPGWANYFPVTRAVPEPPSIRNFGGPAPGPIPFPGAPPYGAAQYGPDGTPLYPGVPPPPAPSQP